MYHKQMIPEHLRWLFWDTTLSSLDPQQWADYCITRVLELGDQPAVKWMRATFSESQIVEVLRNQRRLSRRSANFWSLVYGLPAVEVAALAHAE